MFVAVSSQRQLQFNFMANLKVAIERPEAVAKSNLKFHYASIIFKLRNPLHSCFLFKCVSSRA